MKHKTSLSNVLMTYVGDGEKRTQKKEKGLFLRPSLVYDLIRNWPSVKQYKYKRGLLLFNV